MKRFKPLAILAAISILLLAGCGGEQDQETQKTTPDAVEGEDTATASDGKSADFRAVEAVIDETIIRLKYGDKSGLYENEFEYLRDEETFEDYLQHGEVKWANADSLDHVEVADITFYDRDSALVDAVFHFVASDGTESKSETQLMAYYHNGQWIKPYVSRIDHQLEYEELIRQAEEDAQKEW